MLTAFFQIGSTHFFTKKGSVKARRMRMKKDTKKDTEILLFIMFQII